jgi:hypothetical protein
LECIISHVGKTSNEQENKGDTAPNLFWRGGGKYFAPFLISEMRFIGFGFQIHLDKIEMNKAFVNSLLTLDTMQFAIAPVHVSVKI